MTSYSLKILALILMTIDHIGAILGQSGIAKLFVGMPGQTVLMIYVMLRAVGRMSFPLFAYIFSVSAEKTRSLPKFTLRLLLFAFISEPFYYLSGHISEFSIRTFFPSLVASLLSFKFTNVFFTFAVGAAVILVYKKLGSLKKTKRLIVFAPILLVFLLIAQAVSCDYGMLGVLLTVALYLAPNKPAKLAVAAVWSFAQYLLGDIIKTAVVGALSVTWLNFLYFFFACLVCIALLLFNGKRGKPVKWGFYVYYPLHLLVLSLVSLFVHYYSGFLWG